MRIGAVCEHVIDIQVESVAITTNIIYSKVLSNGTVDGMIVSDVNYNPVFDLNVGKVVFKCIVEKFNMFVFVEYTCILTLNVHNTNIFICFT